MVGSKRECCLAPFLLGLGIAKGSTRRDRSAATFPTRTKKEACVRTVAAITEGKKKRKKRGKKGAGRQLDGKVTKKLKSRIEFSCRIPLPLDKKKTAAEKFGSRSMLLNHTSGAEHRRTSAFFHWRLPSPFSLAKKKEKKKKRRS